MFISYQASDLNEAQKVADYLSNSGVEIYFDRYDGDLRLQSQRDNPRVVTEAICSGINNSSHMVAIVSPNTVSSSWVPFEIGFGYDKTELAVLCLKGIPKGKLPEYARIAKVIRDRWDLNNLISNLTGASVEELSALKRISGWNDAGNPLIDIMDSLIVEK